MPIQYYMRAYNTALSSYVDWIVNDQPDTTGLYSGYSVSDLANITVNRTVQSKIDNKLTTYDPMDQKDGYFIHLNSYNWLHTDIPSTSPVPSQLFGLSIIRGYTAGPSYRDFASMFWDEASGSWKFAYLPYDPGVGEGSSIGTALPITAGSIGIDGYLAIGTNPAQSGIIRIPNSEIIKGRDASNSTDIDLAQIDSSDRIQLGSVTSPVYVASNLLVDTSISHGVSGSSASGFIRLKNNDEIKSRNFADSGDLDLIKTIGDAIYIGDFQSTGILHNTSTGNTHAFFINNVLQSEIGEAFIRFNKDVYGPTIYQEDQTIGNGQPLLIKSQNTAGNDGGLLILSSGGGAVNDGYLDISIDNSVKIRTFGDTSPVVTDYVHNPSDNLNSVILFNPSLRFYDTLTSPIINQSNLVVGTVCNNLTVQAQSSLNVNSIGGHLVLGAGMGTYLHGTVDLQVGGLTSAQLGLDPSLYFSLGVAAKANSGLIRLPNNTEIKARNASDSTDIYIIGTDALDRVVIADSSTKTVIMGDLEVVGTTTTIDSTVVDIADRVIHLNYTTGIAPVPSLITGIAIHRGNTGIDRDHSALVWNESDGYWKFGYILNGDDLTLTTTLPVMSEFVVSTPSATGTYVAAQSGSFRTINNVVGGSARNSTNSADIAAWSTNVLDQLVLGTNVYDTRLDGYNVFINSTKDIVFNSDATSEYIIFDGLNNNLYVNLVGPQAYLKAVSGTGAYIDLPGASLTSSENFAIDGYHVENTVIAANLNTLTNGSNADALHIHAGTAPTVIPIYSGAYVPVIGNYDGYLMPDFTLNNSELPVCLVSYPGTLMDFRINLGAAPGVGENITFMVRKNNVDTGITITISDANTTGSDILNNTLVVAGDLISIRVTTSNGAAPENVIASLNIVIP